MQTPVTVAPNLSPPVTYSVQTTGSDPQTVPGSNCSAIQCQYQIMFTSPPSNNLAVTLIVSNGIGSGQSVELTEQGLLFY